jgi:hypothetical protein
MDGVGSCLLRGLHGGDRPKRLQPRDVCVFYVRRPIDAMPAPPLGRRIRALGMPQAFERHPDGRRGIGVQHDLPALRVEETDEPVEFVGVHGRGRHGARAGGLNRILALLWTIHRPGIEDERHRAGLEARIVRRSPSRSPRGA